MTPYRSAPAASAPDALVICARCAAHVPFERASAPDEHHCPACGLLQARDAVDVGHGALRFTSLDARPYEELEPFAKELTGFERAKCVSISFTCDGMPIKASLSIDSGAVRGLDLVASTSGLPAMIIMAEKSAERRAKASGLSSEIQTGDAAFDDEVYLDTSADAASVQEVFVCTAVRLAVRELVSMGVEITVSPTNVRLHARNDLYPFSPPHLTRKVHLLRALAGAPRVTEIRYEAEPARVKWVTKGAFLLLPATIASLVLGFILYEPVRPTSKLLLLPGFVVAQLLTPAFRRALRGRSMSHRDLLRVRIWTTLVMPFLGWGVIVALNGVLDRGPEQVEPFHVFFSEPDPERPNTLVVHGMSARGERYAFPFDDLANASPDDHVDVTTSAGAFGWRWRKGSPRFVGR